MIHLTDHLLPRKGAILSVTSIQHHAFLELGVVNARIASLRMFCKIREPDWHFVPRHAMQRSILRAGGNQTRLDWGRGSAPTDTSTT